MSPLVTRPYVLCSQATKYRRASFLHGLLHVNDELEINHGWNSLIRERERLTVYDLFCLKQLAERHL